MLGFRRFPCLEIRPNRTKVDTCNLQVLNAQQPREKNFFTTKRSVARETLTIGSATNQRTSPAARRLIVRLINYRGRLSARRYLQNRPPWNYPPTYQAVHVGTITWNATSVIECNVRQRLV